MKNDIYIFPWRSMYNLYSTIFKDIVVAMAANKWTRKHEAQWRTEPNKKLNMDLSSEACATCKADEASESSKGGLRKFSQFRIFAICIVLKLNTNHKSKTKSTLISINQTLSGGKPSTPWSIFVTVSKKTAQASRVRYKKNQLRPFAASAFKLLWRYAEPSSESHNLVKLVVLTTNFLPQW